MELEGGGREEEWREREEGSHGAGRRRERGGMEGEGGRREREEGSHGAGRRRERGGMEGEGGR